MTTALTQHEHTIRCQHDQCTCANPAWEQIGEVRHVPNPRHFLFFTITTIGLTCCGERMQRVERMVSEVCRMCGASRDRSLMKELGEALWRDHHIVRFSLGRCVCCDNVQFDGREMGGY